MSMRPINSFLILYKTNFQIYYSISATQHLTFNRGGMLSLTVDIWNRLIKESDFFIIIDHVPHIQLPINQKYHFPHKKKYS